MRPEWMLTAMVSGIAAAPAIAFALLALYWLLARAPSEAASRRIVMSGLGISLAASAGTAVTVAVGRHAPATIALGHWFSTTEHSFELGARVDALSGAMAVLVAAVTALIGRFSGSYLHAQPGFARFFMLLALFATGMQLIVLGATLDLLFVGWELVGLTSALLVAFFHQRRMPVSASIRVFATYRVCDLGLLIGLVLLHQAAGTSDLVQAAGGLGAHAHLGGAAATLVPLALLFAVMGKSAQFPLGGWLPRAMEGPTPSSALFYGALSVHAGVYLLIRAQPLLADSAIATAAALAIGGATAVHGGLVGRVQTDAKSALAYATMTQVGVMIVEIAAGLPTLAALHLFGHAILRAFQLLRVPSALRDAEALHATGAHVHAPPWVISILPDSLARHAHHLALERFGLDVMLERMILEPLLAAGRALDRLEQRFVSTLTGHPRSAHPPARVPPPASGSSAPPGAPGGPR